MALLAVQAPFCSLKINFVVRYLKDNFALYAKNFPIWSEQSSGMLQHVVWLRLAEINVGASLQHYNEDIEADVGSGSTIPTDETRRPNAFQQYCQSSG